MADSLPWTTVRDVARDRLEADVERLVRYAQVETPTGDAAAIDRLADLLVADTAADWSVAERVGLDGGDALVLAADGPARTPADQAPEAPALLLGHLDTVHPRGSLAGDVPLVRDGDVLRGPGTYDMKAGIVVATSAVSVLASLGIAHRPVRLVLTPDEEIGSPQSRPLVEREARTAAYVLGFESPHPDGALKSARRGSTRVRMTVHGRGSHAALAPEEGVHAIDELVDRLVELRTVTAGRDGVLCNVGTVRGGGRTNVVPDLAEAEIGMRFVSQGSEREVLAALQEIRPERAGAELETVVLSSRPAWEASEGDAALLAAVTEAGRALGQDVAGRPAAGAADTNLTGALGVPSLDGFGPRGGGAHATSEHVVVSSIADRVALVAAVLAR